MRNLVLAAAAIGAIGASQLTTSTPAAAAVVYPYCMQSGQFGFPGQCSFRSFAECRESAQGRGGNCVVNPRYAYWEQQGGYPMGWSAW